MDIKVGVGYKIGGNYYLRAATVVDMTNMAIYTAVSPASIYWMGSQTFCLILNSK